MFEQIGKIIGIGKTELFADLIYAHIGGEQQPFCDLDLFIKDVLIGGNAVIFGKFPRDLRFADVQLLADFFNGDLAVDADVERLFDQICHRGSAFLCLPAARKAERDLKDDARDIQIHFVVAVALLRKFQQLFKQIAAAGSGEHDLIGKSVRRENIGKDLAEKVDPDLFVGMFPVRAVAVGLPGLQKIDAVLRYFLPSRFRFDVAVAGDHIFEYEVIPVLAFDKVIFVWIGDPDRLHAQRILFERIIGKADERFLLRASVGDIAFRIGQFSLVMHQLHKFLPRMRAVCFKSSFFRLIILFSGRK